MLSATDIDVTDLATTLPVGVSRQVSWTPWDDSSPAAPPPPPPPLPALIPRLQLRAAGLLCARDNTCVPLPPPPGEAVEDLGGLLLAAVLTSARAHTRHPYVSMVRCEHGHVGAARGGGVLHAFDEGAAVA
eukprot:gene46980-31778_t